MNLIWGAILIIFSLLCWVGQTISTFSPKVATRLGLTEPESDVDPTFYADVRGEAIWDTMANLQAYKAIEDFMKKLNIKGSL